MKYSVMFGFEVEAKDMESAQRKAKKNLKPKKDRDDVDLFRVRVMNKGVK
jgi:hypothetical protein